MTWEQDTTNRVGHQLAKSRKARKMSAQALADRTAELGYPIGRATISEYENGRRKSITVCELLILAAALDIPPISLLYGSQLADGEVEVIPGKRKKADQALMWATGELPGRTDTPRSPEEQAISLVRSRMSLYAYEQLQAHTGDGLQPAHVNLLLQQRRQTADQMHALGLIVGVDGDDQ